MYFAASAPSSSTSIINNLRPRLLFHRFFCLVSSSSRTSSANVSRISTSTFSPCHLSAVWTPLHRMSGNTSSSFSSSSSSGRSCRSGGGGRGRGGGRDRPRGRGAGGTDRVDALGRLLTRILRHMAPELRLNMRSDGYVKVGDLLNLHLKSSANVPLSSHSVDEVREAVRRDTKQRFGLSEENGELLIRANQGHSIETVESEQLLTPILSPEEVSVCVHGTYRRNLDSIMRSGLRQMNRLHVHFSCGLPSDGQVISGMRRDVNVLIYLDVKKALDEGMKLFISENKVILTEGFDGVVPSRYFLRVESWPDRTQIPPRT